MTAGESEIQAVLFDLGGVVVEVNDMAAALREAGVVDHETFMQTWLHCPAVRDFESGRSDIETFAQGVIENQNLSVTPEAFLDAFEAWPKGLFPSIKALIAEVRQRVVVGCLSNTNPIHWPMFAAELDDGAIFDHPIVSYQIGLMKPDREIFDYAIEQVGLPAETILFLDDHPTNVTAARGVGLRAERVFGPDTAREALVAHGVLPN